MLMLNTLASGFPIARRKCLLFIVLYPTLPSIPVVTSVVQYQLPPAVRCPPSVQLPCCRSMIGNATYTSQVPQEKLICNAVPSCRTASIPGWWIWVYWATPFSWTLRAMTAVELTSSDWGDLGKVGGRKGGTHPFRCAAYMTTREEAGALLNWPLGSHDERLVGGLLVRKAWRSLALMPQAA